MSYDAYVINLEYNYNFIININATIKKIVMVNKFLNSTETKSYNL